MALTQLTKVDGGGISTTSDYRVGVITASKFVGPFDGTGGNFSGVVTATNGVFSGNISAVDGNFSGNVTIGGTLTYEDVTNIDSVGLITARNGLIVTGVSTFQDIDVDGHTNLDNVSIAGVTTFTDDVYFDGATAGRDITFDRSANKLVFKHNSILEFGEGTYYTQFKSDGVNFKLTHNPTTSFYLYANTFAVIGAGNRSGTTYNNTVISVNNGVVNLGFELPNGGATIDNLTTTEKGITVGTGVTIERNGQASFAGISTFYNNLFVSKDFDVDGHTNLDNVSIAGVTTSSGNISVVKSSGTATISVQSSDNYATLEIGGQTGAFIDLKSPASDDYDIRYTHDGFIYAKTNINLSPQAGYVVNVNKNLNCAEDLDVDGHTNLDNVSVVGVSTFTGDVILTNSNHVTQVLKAGGSTSDLAIDFKDSSNNLEARILCASDQGDLRFYTGGTNERLRIDSSGRLSVGRNLANYVASSMSSAANDFIITAAAGSNGGMTIVNSGNNDIGNIFFANGSSESGIGRIQYEHQNNAMVFQVNNNERLRIDSDGNLLLKDAAGQGNSLEHYIRATDSSGNTQYQLGMISSGNQDLYLQQNKNAAIRFQTSGNTRWKIDGDPGHLIPEVAGAVDIGSTSAEIGNVYIADLKHIYFGNDQDLDMRFDGSNAAITLDTGSLSIINYANNEDVKILSDNGSGGVTNYIIADGGTGEVLLHHYGSERFATSEKGITVTGEVAASQDYPNQRPTLDFNFAKTKALDPRLTYLRSGPASYYDDRGLLVLVGDDTPRFDHDPMTRESKGILLEESRRNMQPHSIQYGLDGSDGWVNIVSAAYVDYNPGVVTPTGDTIGAITFKDIGGTSQHYMSTDVVTVSSGTTYTFSFFFKNISGSDANNLKITTSGGNLPYEIRSYYFSGTDIGTSTGDDTTITELPNGWWRGTYVVTASGNGNAALIFDFHALNNGAPKNNVVAIYGLQCEIGDFPTSYIPTDGNLAIRGGDNLTMTGSDLTDVFNEVEGTMFYEASLESLTRDNQPVVAFRDISSTTSDYHAMGWRIGGSSDSIRTWFRAGGGNEFLSAHSSNGLTTKMFYKHIYGYKLSDCADAYRTATNSGIQATGDGSVTGDGTPMITQGLIDELRFGEYYSLGDTYKLDAGHIKRFSYWTQKLTNTQLTTYIS